MKPFKPHFLITLFAFLHILLATPLPGQKISKQILIGGANEDFLGEGILTNDKGFLLAGTSESGISGDKTEKCFGDYDYWIIKTNQKGKIQWQRTLGGDKEEEPLAVLETNDSGFLICGSSSSGVSGNKTVANLGDSDFWLVKLDKAGKTEWQKGYGRKKVDYLVAAMHDPTGGYILAGYSWFEPADLPAGSQKGRFDYWVVAIDEKGEMKWEQSFGGNHDDVLTDAKLDQNGQIILAGYSLSGAKGDKTEPCLGNFDYWTLCLNKERKIVWQKTLGSDKDDRPESIFQDIKKQYYIGGSAPINTAGQNLSNFWVGMLSEKGEYLRDMKAGGDDNDYLITISQTNDGGIFYAGNSGSGISGDKSEETYGYHDGWIIKYDSSGKKLWDKSIGGTGQEGIQEIIPYRGRCYTLLMSSDSGKTGNLTEEGNGKTDILIIRLKDKVR